MIAVSYQRYCPKVPNRKNSLKKMLCTLEPQISKSWLSRPLERPESQLPRLIWKIEQLYMKNYRTVNFLYITGETLKNFDLA